MVSWADLEGANLVPHTLRIGGAWSSKYGEACPPQVPHTLRIGGAWSTNDLFGWSKIVPHTLRIGGAWSGRVTNPLFPSTQS